MLPREVCFTDLNNHTDCYINLFIAYTLSDYQVHLQTGCMHQHVFVCVCARVFLMPSVAHPMVGSNIYLQLMGMSAEAF